MSTLTFVPKVQGNRGFLLAILPPGAFIGLGLLIAVKNIIDDKATKPRPVSVGDVEEQN